MTILTLDDITVTITEDILNEVIEGDETILDTLELRALGEMTGYLSIRYDAASCYDRTLINPNPPTHNGYSAISTVLQYLVDIMLYHAHARIMPDNVPELREKRYKNAVSWLEKVADGFIAPALPVKSTEPSTPLRYGNSSTSQNSYY